MSTIRVDSFGPSAGGTTYSARGIAKAWVNFNGTGTIASRDSENVSSLTDNGVATYVVNLTNAMSNTNAACTGFTHASGVAWMASPRCVLSSASAVAFQVINIGASAVDSNENGLAVYGDLA